MNTVICLDKFNNILCWGSIDMCENYIKQFYTVSIDNVYFENYSPYDYGVWDYEDYEVYNIQGTDVYLTLGEIDMIKNGCQEETNGIKFIQEELERLSTLTNVFSKSIIEELKYMQDFMKELFDIHARYNADTVFTNLDVEALHHAFQTQRENAGLPIMFIK